MTDQNCIDCGHSTKFGTGLFVNRIPADDGFICPNCAAFDCDRCGQKIPIDEDLTPHEIYGEDRQQYFEDGSYRVCENCITKTEKKQQEQRND